jgi:PEP-CTERM motif
MRIPLAVATCAAVFGLAALYTTSAQAGELCTGPAIAGVPSSADVNAITNGSSCGLTATASPIVAMFMGFSAQDTDSLTLAGVTPNPIFVNNGSTVGSTVSLNVPLGALNFVLNNQTTGLSYNIATPYVNTDNPTSTVYHFADFTFTTGANDAADEALYNLVFLGTPMTAGEFATIESTGGFAAWTFVGVEDLAVAPTDDFNDLVYGFNHLTSTTVPEPLTLSLFGAGIFGISALRRRKKKVA